MLVGPAGFVWIATRGGLWRFDGERFDAALFGGTAGPDLLLGPALSLPGIDTKTLLHSEILGRRWELPARGSVQSFRPAHRPAKERP